MAQATFQLPAIPVDTGKTPATGSKAIPVTYDFSVQATFVTDLTTQKQQGKMFIFQSIYIDNSGNNQPVTVQMAGLGQKISIPAQYQGIFPVFVSDQPVFTVTSPGSGKVLVAFSNAALAAAIWATVPNPVSVSGSIQTSNPILDATVSSNRVQTLDRPAAITYVDHSGSITAGGVSQNVLAANPARQGFIIQNIDTAILEDLAINCTGGPASVGTAGSLTIAAGGGAGYPGGTFQGGAHTGTVNIGAATTGHKFTCMEW